MDLHKIEKIKDIQNYILGGKADFVVRWLDIEDHINFMVRKDAKNNKIFYIKFKSIDWVYIGYIKMITIQHEEDTYIIPVFFPLKPSTQVEKHCKIFKTLLYYIYYLEQLPNNIEILYTGICSICGRRLTDPIYIKIGIGKICLQK